MPVGSALAEPWTAAGQEIHALIGQAEPVIIGLMSTEALAERAAYAHNTVLSLGRQDDGGRDGA